jgi:hypothetical protein
VSRIGGPFAAESGANYLGKMGALPLGKHNYVITATDKLGRVSTSRGSFTMTAPPKINDVAAMVARRLISWKVAAPAGVASYVLRIDGKAVSQITAPSVPGRKYFGKMDALAAGKHNFAITVTDNAGRVVQARGSFTLTAAKAARNAVFLNAARTALSNSVKVDWLYDLGGIGASTQSSGSKKSTSASAVDTVLAGY